MSRGLKHKRRTKPQKKAKVRITPIDPSKPMGLPVNFTPSSRMTPEYIEYIASKVWRKKRRRVFYRDKHKCQECGATRWLQVHHLTYKRLFREPLSDLITLCRDCHKAAHGITD